MSKEGWYRACTWLDEASKRNDVSGVFFGAIDSYLRSVDMSISAYINKLHNRATGGEVKNGGAYYSVKKVAEGKRILFPYLVDHMTEVFSKEEREYLCWYYVHTKKGDVRRSQLLASYYDKYEGKQSPKIPEMFEECSVTSKEDEEISIKKLSQKEKLRKEMNRKEILERALAIEVAEGRLHKSIPYGELKATWK